MTQKNALQTEDIAWALWDALMEHLPDALERITERRTREAFALPDPHVITFGFNEIVLTLPVDAYPRVSVLAAPVSIGSGRTGKVTEAVHSVLVEWLVAVAPSDQGVDAIEDARLRATLMAWRYGEAVLTVFKEHGPYAGWDYPLAVPPVDEGMTQALRLNPDRRDYISGFLCGGTATIPLAGSYIQ